MTTAIHAVVRLLYTEDNRARSALYERLWVWPLPPQIGMRVYTAARPDTGERLELHVDRISIDASTGDVHVLLIPRPVAIIVQETITVLGDEAWHAPESRAARMDAYITGDDAKAWGAVLESCGFAVRPDPRPAG